MTEMPNQKTEPPVMMQTDFERITRTVAAEFQIEEALLDHGIPTYYLQHPQETKQPFLNLLKQLEPMNLIAILRRTNKRTALRIISKPPTKPSNIKINWALFLATIATTFITGYLLSPAMINPYIGGASFMIAMLAILGTHEMGHKITANKKGVDATPPYFLPGPPPLGTLGAVIMQKSLPPNRDALFDIGADGPIAGFIIATIVSAIGLTMLIPSEPLEASTIGSPMLWYILAWGLENLNMIPAQPEGGMLLLHPFAFAGWVGVLVTMLNLLPAGMLDGGHVAKSLAGEKLRFVLTALSILYLFVLGVYVMAILVLFLSMHKHPGPLDDVSSLSTKRKLLIIGLIAIFVLCTPPSLRLL